MPSDLEYRLQPLREKIQVPETEESWDKIAKAIASLTVLIREEVAEYPTELTKLLRSLYRPLTNAAISERTRLSAVALELFKTSADSLGRSFTTIIPLYLPTLLTLCNRPNKVVITRAKACIISIIESTQAPSILSFLATAVSDKAVSLRLAASECALACLNTFNPPDLEKETRAKEIEMIIKSTATDASADVRKIGRKIFDAYKILLPNRVDSFTSPMTPTIRKYLDIRVVRAPAAPQSNPPSRPASSMSTHSVNSLHAVSRPKSTVSQSSSSNQLSKSSSTRNGTSHARTASSNSIPQSDSAPNLATRLMSSTSSQSSARSGTGPSRPPRGPPVQRGPSRTEMMPPPQSLPLRPPVSPTSSTASDYFAELASSTKTPGPIRPITGPSRVPQNEVHDHTATAKPRVIGGARRVLLPDPPAVGKDTLEVTTSKPPVRPGPSRSTTAPVTTHTSRPPISSSNTATGTTTTITATAAKVIPKPPVRSRTESTVKPKVLSPSTNTNKASTSIAAIARPVKLDAGVTVRTRTVSRLTEPTQAQLARAKATTRPPATKSLKEVAKPLSATATSRIVASKSTSVAKTAPVEKERKKKVGPEIPTVTTKRREKTPVTEPEKIVEVAKMVPLPPSPKGEALILFPASPEDHVVGDEPAEGEELVVDEEIVESKPHALETPSESEAESGRETEPETDMNFNAQSEMDQPGSELVEEVRPVESHLAPEEIRETIHEPDIDENEDEEDLDEDTLRESQDTAQDLPQFFLQLDPSPSTPQARPPASQAQLVPETPISALLVSIQKGFEFSPSQAFDPDQTMTFGGLLPRDRAQCEPLFLGDRRRR